MTVRDRIISSGIDRATAALLAAALALAVLHHLDHVLRVDHSGWPFRTRVTPFTFSLLAYPVMLFALFGPRQLYWWRWLGLLAGAIFVVLAHTMIESPHMQFTMWAENRSVGPGASAAVHNLPEVQSPALGIASVIVGMALNVIAVAATVAMLANGVRARARAR